MLDKITKDKHLIFLFIFGFTFKFFFLFIFYPEVALYPDSFDYITLYEYLSAYSLDGYNGWRSPGYSLLFFLTKGNLDTIVIIQLILGVISSLLFYKILLNLKIPIKLSFYATIFFQTLLNVVVYEISILTETFILFFLTIIVYLLSKGWLKNKCIKEEIVLGICLGYLTLIKPFFAFLPFLFYILFLLNDFNWKKVINKKLLVFIFPLISYFGWSYVNKVHTGYFVSTTFFGLNIAQNCVHFAEKSPKEYKWISEPYVKYREKSKDEKRILAYSIWYAYHEGAFNKYNLSFPDLSHELGKYGKTLICENPLEYLKQVIFHSFLDFWKPNILWKTPKIKNATSIIIPIWNIQFYILLIIRFIFVIITMCYLYNFILTRKTNTITLLTFIVFSTAILQAIVTYGSNSRYSFPLEFIMLIVVVHFLSNFKFHSILQKFISNNTRNFNL